VRTLSIATTPLALFQDCPRRFRLRHLLGLEEPAKTGQLDLFGAPPPAFDLQDDSSEHFDPDADPRVIGRAAHRVLELWPRSGWGKPTVPSAVVPRLVAEGLARGTAETTSVAEAVARFLSSPYARAICGGDHRIHREDEFVLTIDLPRSPGHPPRSLALRGAIDLIVERPGGMIDVIDYKRSRPRTDLSPYAFQLRAYALALHRKRPDHRIRAGVFFLGAPGEPVFLPGRGPQKTLDRQEHERFFRELEVLAGRFLEARWADRFDGVAAEVCGKLQCGFLEACHGGAAGQGHLHK
jgi:ATP-dependent helicase/nuclease subunit A